VLTGKEVLDRLAEAGFKIPPSRFENWRERGLLPPADTRPGRGRGLGGPQTSTPRSRSTRSSRSWRCANRTSLSRRLVGGFGWPATRLDTIAGSMCSRQRPRSLMLSLQLQ
jgi:hypothetical protein